MGNERAGREPADTPAAYGRAAGGWSVQLLVVSGDMSQIGHTGHDITIQCSTLSAHVMGGAPMSHSQDRCTSRQSDFLRVCQGGYARESSAIRLMAADLADVL